jgi:hypothetical protein
MGRRLMSAVPEKYLIVSLFDKTLIEFTDAFWNLTELYADGKTPDDTTLQWHVDRVSNRREKMISCIKSAQYHHGNDLGLVIPIVNLNGGFC